MYQTILNKLKKEGVKLLAVSKTQSASTIHHFYQKGQGSFGENKVQELLHKHEELPKDIEWHFIGHLQRNKVKHIVSFIHLIHAVDSLRLAQKIDHEAKKINKVVDILIQIRISSEISKFGWIYDDVCLQYEELLKLKNIRIVGFMGMATNTIEKGTIRNEFNQINKSFKDFQKRLNKSYFKELSIGMSSDYQLAVKEGATIVRIGSLIFGKRENQE